jgi:hypothetical protein
LAEYQIKRRLVALLEPSGQGCIFALARRFARYGYHPITIL